MDSSRGLNCAPLHLLFLLYIVSAVLVCGQSDFINIDCGKEKDYTYKDVLTGLSYTSDIEYIDTGELHQIASNFRGAGLSSQANDLRSFPEGTRNCFNINPVKQGRKYLIRALFFYGNYDGKNELPQFDMYIGVNFWYRAMAITASDLYYQDIMILTTSDSISICLVNTGSGTPFMSSLELRPLSGDLYPQINSSRALNLHTVESLGATNSIRYPKDPYDRRWVVSNKQEWSTLATKSAVTTITGYEPPSDVMQTAAFPTTGSSLNVSWPYVGKPVPWFYIFLHFSELRELNGNETRMINIKVNDRGLLDTVIPKYLQTTSVSGTYRPQTTDRNEIALSLTQAAGSTLPPILNAVEIYSVVETKQSETDGLDVAAITTIRGLYKLQRKWIGDPCLPKTFIWTALDCSYDGFNSPRIISLNLSSTGLTGEIPTSLANLTHLQYLDLSKNDIRGGIPDFLAGLTRLKYLDLSGNNLTGPVPKDLVDRSATGALVLKIGENTGSCSSSGVCSINKKKKSSLVIAVVVSVASVVILLFVVLVCLLLKRRKRIDNPAAKPSEGKLWSRGKLRTDNGSFLLPSAPLENMQFTYNDLVKVTDDFKNEIGRGGFGPVYHGMLDNKVEVAVKILDKTKSSQGPREFQTEAQLLARIHHRNLVSLIGYCKEIENLSLVYEYMSGGSLDDHLRGKAGKTNPLSWKERIRIAVEAAQGLEYLHSGCNPSIIHRDVKPNNILLNRKLDAKIADFGISKTFEKDINSHISTNVQGTPGYLDPEYYQTRKLSAKSDVYSFGIVLLELVTGLPASFKKDEDIYHIVHWVMPWFERYEISEIVDERLQGEYDINSVWKVIELALACTRPASAERPPMHEVVELLKECLQLETPNGIVVNVGANATVKSKSVLIDMQGECSLLNPLAR